MTYVRQLPTCPKVSSLTRTSLCHGNTAHHSHSALQRVSATHNSPATRQSERIMRATAPARPEQSPHHASQHCQRRGRCKLNSYPAHVGCPLWGLLSWSASQRSSHRLSRRCQQGGRCQAALQRCLRRTTTRRPGELRSWHSVREAAPLFGSVASGPQPLQRCLNLQPVTRFSCGHTREQMENSH